MRKHENLSNREPVSFLVSILYCSVRSYIEHYDAFAIEISYVLSIFIGDSRTYPQVERSSRRNSRWRKGMSVLALLNPCLWKGLLYPRAEKLLDLSEFGSKKEFYMLLQISSIAKCNITLVQSGWVWVEPPSIRKQLKDSQNYLQHSETFQHLMPFIWHSLGCTSRWERRWNLLIVDGSSWPNFFCDWSILMHPRYNN